MTEVLYEGRVWLLTLLSGHFFGPFSLLDTFWYGLVQLGVVLLPFGFDSSKSLGGGRVLPPDQGLFGRRNLSSFSTFDTLVAPTTYLWFPSAYFPNPHSVSLVGCAYRFLSQRIRFIPLPWFSLPDTYFSHLYRSGHAHSSTCPIYNCPSKMFPEPS